MDRGGRGAAARKGDLVEHAGGRDGESNTRREDGGDLAARRLGSLGEEIAARYLQMNGYRILARNLRCGPAELDLVASRGDIVAIVEVRTRSSSGHGSPEESVRGRKFRTLVRAARMLPDVFPPVAGRRLRCDLIGIERRPFGLQLRHLQGLSRPASR